MEIKELSTMQCNINVKIILIENVLQIKHSFTKELYHSNISDGNL